MEQWVKEWERPQLYKEILQIAVLSLFFFVFLQNVVADQFPSYLLCVL